MAVNKDPILKKCRSLQIDPSHLGIYKESKRTKQQSHRKMSNYGIQLREKQRAKFIYGVLEAQFRNTFEKASKKKGQAGENLLIMLEERLDNVVYRMGLCTTRREGRQLVTHGHYTVNGKKVDIPSYQVKVGDKITLRKRSEEMEMFKSLREGTSTLIPKWLSFDAQNLTGIVNALPTREDIDLQVQENMIVEFYSR